MITLILFALVIGAFLVHCTTSLRRLPSHIPWIGDEAGQVYGRLRAYVRSVFYCDDMLLEGYTKYSKQGLPFVMANIFTGAQVVLPIKYMDFVHDQPEHVLSSFEAHRQFMRADYTFLHPTLFHEHVFQQVIKKQLTRGLDPLTVELAAEIPLAVQHAAKDITDKDGWFELTDHSEWKKIILQTVSRIYVGQKLCRDPEYLEAAATFQDVSMLVAGLIGIVPSLFRPLLAPIFTWRDRSWHAKCAAKTMPVIAERLQLLRSEDPQDVPDDLITWAAQDALASAKHQPFKQEPSFLAARISMMNFVSIDSTSMTIENLLFDVLCNPEVPFFVTSDNKTSLIAALREEALAAYEANIGTENPWKRTLAPLPLLDACLKESLRLNNLLGHTNVRRIVAPKGVEVPGIGHLPCGTNVGFSVLGMHRDDRGFGADVEEWKVDRWMTGKAEEEEVKEEVELNEDEKSTIKRSNTAVYGGGGVGMEVDYLPFGYRRNACPGRFFALRVVRLVLLHLLLFYDIELPEGSQERPKNPFLGVSRGPPMGGRLRFRRNAYQTVQ